MTNLYSRDLCRVAAFYSELGFVEAFRTPESGQPVHIELTLDEFTLGIATMEAAKAHHNRLVRRTPGCFSVSQSLRNGIPPKASFRNLLVLELTLRTYTNPANRAKCTLGNVKPTARKSISQSRADSQIHLPS